MKKITILIIAFLIAGVVVATAGAVVNLKDWTKVEIVKDSSDYYLEVARGNIDGQSSINKFGHNPATTTGDDVWGGGGLYEFYPETAQIMEIQSTSSEDDVGGTGAIQVMVEGLDENWEMQSEMITMNGTTPVLLSKTYVRMFRAYAQEAGSADTNIGDITVDIVTVGTVAIFITAGNGQTQHAIYTVPAGKTAYFVKGYVGFSTDDKTSENVIFQWMMRFNNGVNGAWLVQGEIGTVNLGSGNWQYLYGVPAGPLPEKTDIRIHVSDASGTFDTVGGYDLVLIDNE